MVLTSGNSSNPFFYPFPVLVLCPLSAFKNRAYFRVERTSPILAYVAFVNWDRLFQRTQFSWAWDKSGMDNKPETEGISKYPMFDTFFTFT